MAVVMEHRHEFTASNGQKCAVIVRLKDNAYRNCGQEEFEKRKKHFLDECARLYPIALEQSRKT